jgi:hypothetical protein
MIPVMDLRPCARSAPGMDVHRAKPSRRAVGGPVKRVFNDDDHEANSARSDLSLRPRGNQWVDDPLPTINIPSSRNGANAAPNAKCFYNRSSQLYTMGIHA